MLDDSQMQPQDLEDLRFLPDIMVPPQHSGDLCLSLLRQCICRDIALGVD